MSSLFFPTNNPTTNNLFVLHNNTLTKCIPQFIHKKHTKSNKISKVPTPFDPPPSIMYTPSPSISRPEEGNRGPTAGRSIPVSGNVMMCYRRLWSVLNNNKIRQEVRRNRYYEKPTIRRKRIRREISEARFKEAVRKKVWLILQMKARGL
ncbi:2427_t:CDS:2 [Dentiscutata heterogama]|uniref:2427_t:CDS:1 n=1 Tax=Dentiscutata heterogama TaxID=1316150 RepID=A0ACA9KEK2_9GLOM|nr:2427_t:CDS:2 [Dentiscutata heterogama]